MPTVTVVPDGITVDLDDGETILGGLFRHGYAYRVGCRRGGCAICMVDLVHGAVDYTKAVADTVLSDDAQRAGSCLSCRAVPMTDVTISLREESLRCVNPLARYARAAAAT